MNQFSLEGEPYDWEDLQAFWDEVDLFIQKEYPATRDDMENEFLNHMRNINREE